MDALRRSVEGETGKGKPGKAPAKKAEAPARPKRKAASLECWMRTGPAVGVPHVGRVYSRSHLHPTTDACPLSVSRRKVS